MGHDAVEFQLREGAERFARRRVEVGAGADALAGHAGVDFEMDWERLLRGGVGGEPVQLLGEPDDGGEAMGARSGDVGGLEAAHEEDVGLVGFRDRGGGEGLADGDAFLGVGDAEPLGAGSGRGWGRRVWSRGRRRPP